MNRLLTLQRAAHASPVAIGLLVLANLVPLVGVLFLGWDLPTLVAIYWAENGVVGIFAVGRILSASGPTRPADWPPPPPGDPAAAGAAAAFSPAVARLFLAPFFCVHYGIFWLGHGVFVWFALPMLFAMAGAPEASPRVGVVASTALFLLASHGASFVFNWIIGGESEASTPGAEMIAPYARVVILHVTIVIGAFAVAILGAPIWALVVMVVAKTMTDLAAHLAERHRAAGRMAGTGRAIPGFPANP